MPKIECLSSVGIFTKDQKRSRDFFTRRIGLVVRDSMPRVGYLALGATKGGEDATLDVWQPDPSWGPMYEPGLKQVGTVTGVGFSTANLAKTVDGLRRRKVEVHVSKDPGDEDYARFKDPDGNTLFLFEDPKAAVRRPGFSRLAFVTVVARDGKRSGEFFGKALGMRGRETGDGFFAYRLSSRGTSVMPFTPNREMYDDPADYDADMAHIGEETSINFETSGIEKTQEALMARGVRFKEKAERKDWGGKQAKFFDPDDNVYSLIEPEP